MAYAELWQPINNAVQNVNQTINTISDRADRRQAQGLQSLMAMDSLKGKQIDRDLATAANQRAERQQRLQESGMDFQQKLALQQEKRQKALFEAGIPQRKLAQVQAQEALKPRAVPISTFFSTPEDVSMAVETGVADQLATVFGGPGSKYNAETSMFESADGKQIQMNMPQIQASAPAVAGLVAATVDPRSTDKAKENKLTAEIKELEDQYNKIAKNPKLPGAIVRELDYKIAKKTEALKAIEKKKPWDRIDEYEARQRRLVQTGAWLEAIGKPVSMISDAAKANAAILDGLYEEKENHLTGGKSGTGITQKWAVKTDKVGNPIPGSMMLVNTPKNMIGSMSPTEVDPRLKGYVWKEGAEFDLQLDKEGRIDGQWMSGYRLLQDAFGKFNSETQWFVDEDKSDQFQMARSMYSEFYDELNKDFGRAADRSIKQSEVYYNKFKSDIEELNLQANTGRNSEGKPVNRDGAKKDLDDKVQNFVNAFGFVPGFVTK
jgi:hypothetical protein